MDSSLTEDDRFYRALFEHMLNGFVYCRMAFENGRPVDFVHLKVNKTFGEITGMSNVVGRRCSEVIPDIRKSDPVLFETFGRVALTGNPERFEHYVEAAQGWFSIAAYSPRSEHFVAVFEEITARKQAELALRSSEASLRTALEYSPNPVFIVERGGRFTFANRQAEVLLGYTRDEIVRMGIPAMVHPDQVAHAMAAFQLNLSGRDQFIETTLLRKDGVSVIAEVNGILLPGGEVLAEVRDITEMRLTEERLRSSERSFRAVFERSPIGIAISGVDQRFRLANPAMCDLLGYGEDELLGMQIADITHPDDLAASLDEVARMAAGDTEHFSTVSRYVRKNGGILWVSLNVVVMKGERKDEIQVILLMEDITARRELEQERLKFAHQQKETLVREVHHRIKNNLQSVAGLLQRELGRFVDLDPRLATAIGQVNAVAMVHGLQSAGEDEAIRLRDSVENICRTISGITQQPVIFRVSGEASMASAVELQGDEAVSVALLLNELILNAVKHSPRGSEAPTVSMRSGALITHIVIRNAAAGSTSFDIDTGHGLGTGLRLVRSMLPHEGARLTHAADGAGFMLTNLELAYPVIVMRATPEKRTGDG